MHKPAREQGRNGDVLTKFSNNEPEATVSGLQSPVSALPPRTAEELEHFDHERLDDAWEWIISAHGCILPIAGARDMVRAFAGELAVAAAAGSTTMERRPISTLSNGSDSARMPKLKPDATEIELREFAADHPLVKLVIEKFEAEIVAVTRV